MTRSNRGRRIQTAGQDEHQSRLQGTGPDPEPGRRNNSLSMRNLFLLAQWIDANWLRIGGGTLQDALEAAKQELPFKVTYNNLRSAGKMVDRKFKGQHGRGDSKRVNVQSTVCRVLLAVTDELGIGLSEPTRNILKAAASRQRIPDPEERST